MPKYETDALRAIRSMQQTHEIAGHGQMAERMRAIGDQVERMMQERRVLLEALQITAGNIKSLGPAGALGSAREYEEWLRLVEEAIWRCRP